jgi:hypothetical protein
LVCDLNLPADLEIKLLLMPLTGGGISLLLLLARHLLGKFLPFLGGGGKGGGGNNTILALVLTVAALGGGYMFWQHEHSQKKALETANTHLRRENERLAKEHQNLSNQVNDYNNAYKKRIIQYTQRVLEINDKWDSKFTEFLPTWSANKQVIEFLSHLVGPTLYSPASKTEGQHNVTAKKTN